MSKYYIVSEDILPDVFEQVIEVKRLLQSGQAKNISEAVKACNISRGTYYKYKDSIFSLQQDVAGRKAVITMTITGGCGTLSQVLNLLSDNKVNILAINQSIPVNGIHTLDFTLDLSNVEIGIEALLAQLEKLPMISKTTLIAVE